MNEFDNEELVASFEEIMTLFEPCIAPFALEICEHLKQQYIRLVKQDEADDEEGESIMAALASLSSVRRVINATQSDEALLLQVEAVVYPCLLHSVSVDGFDSIEEGLDCITMLLHYAHKTNPISDNLWTIFPQLLFITVGHEGEDEGGLGFEYVAQIVTTL